MRTGTRLEQVSVLTLLGLKKAKEKVQGADGGGREDNEWRRQIEGGGGGSGEINGSPWLNGSSMFWQ
jgi:hypothetical protein